MLTSLILAAALAGQAPAKSEAPKPGPAKAKAKARPAAKAKATIAATDEKARLIAKRKVKKSAAYVARVDREAREAQAAAKAEAEARAEFNRQLPHLVRMRGQDLERLSAAERNAIWNKFLNDGGYNGVIKAPTPAPPRIVNMPGQPLAP